MAMMITLGGMILGITAAIATMKFFARRKALSFTIFLLSLAIGLGTLGIAFTTAWAIDPPHPAVTCETPE